MNRKIWKALGIAVCMLALAAPRAMAETKVHMVTAQTDLVKLFEEINKTGDDDENVIELHENITLTDNYKLYNCKTTTIKGEGHTIFVEPNAGITVTGKGNVLNLGAKDYKGTLTIDGKTSGGSASGNAKNAFVSVLERATANMYENVTLQDLDRQSTVNACVKLEGNSVFNMHGGVIQNCKSQYSGGLYADKSTVTISGGTISGCEGNLGGGLYAKNSSTIEISGGEISRCTAGTGGGLYADRSTITISGGTISECEANAGGGLYADNSTVTIKDGTISGCKAVNGYGGGLYAKNYSTVTIEGGTISECCTTSDIGMGGGLYAYSSTITISGGTIKNNKAIYGGGVALNSVTKFEKPITNWTVIGNEAYKTKSGSGNGGIGGGIYLDNGKDVLMDISDGSNKIYNNQAKGHGADICLDGRTSSIKLPIAANMGATYLDSGINIDGWYNDNPRYEPSESGERVKELQRSGKQSLVASYKADPVRIEIDANGGVGGSGSQTVHKGTTVTLEAPTKEGYLFTGWEDENKKIYPAGEDGKVKITVTGAMTLTAVWKDRTFTVTYVLLNGKTRTETAAYGQNVTLGEEPRTGYTFVGWKDSEKVYHAGETITVTEDKTLTAEWKKLPSAENLPKTGDESPVLLWGAALAVSAAACFMLRRRK